MRCFSAIVVGIFLITDSTCPPEKNEPVAVEIIRKAIEAQGGKAKLARLFCYHIKAKGKNFTGPAVGLHTTEMWYKHPNQLKLVGEGQINGELQAIVLIVNNGEVWQKINGKVQLLSAGEKQFFKDAPYVNHVRRLFPLLEEPGFTLASLGEITEQEVSYLGVKVSSPGHEDVKLFFDKKTGLLTKTATRIIGSKQQVYEAVDHDSDYKDWGGGLMSASKTTRFLNGKKVSESEIFEQNFLKDLEPGIFQKP